MAGGQVRIIGGKWKGRKLAFPARAQLRPSLGRVRETLFNWLVAEVAGARCLDLFAGSGALGLEALSRGAASAGLLDSDRRVCAALADNLRRIGSGAEATVRCQDARGFLAQAARSGSGSAPGDPLLPPWDLVFLDPPFDGYRQLDALLSLLRDEALLCVGGLVYLERPRDAALAFDGWRIEREATAGDCRFGLLARFEADGYHPALS